MTAHPNDNVSIQEPTLIPQATPDTAAASQPEEVATKADAVTGVSSEGVRKKVPCKFSSYFSVNTNLSHHRVFPYFLPSHSLRLLNFILISLSFVDFTIAQLTATLESLLN